jgi:hypothetical protein
LRHGCAVAMRSPWPSFVAGRPLDGGEGESFPAGLSAGRWIIRQCTGEFDAPRNGSSSWNVFLHAPASSYGMQQGTVHGLSTYTRSSSTNNSDSTSDSSICSNSSKFQTNGAARRTPKANMERPRETINSEARSSLIGPCPVVFSLCDCRLHPRRATAGTCFCRWRRRRQVLPRQQRPCRQRRSLAGPKFCAPRLEWPRSVPTRQ